MNEDTASSSGFTLLEVLVALAILGVALGLLLPIFSRVLENVSDGTARVNATNIAQSLLSRVGADMPLAEGVSTGQLDEKYRWRIKIGPYRDGEVQDFPLVNAYEVEVEVSWDTKLGAHSVVLDTLRLSPKG